MAGADTKVVYGATVRQRFARVFVDELRNKILEELNKRDMSASQFFEEFGGGSVTRVWRHFQVLEKYGWIEKVEKKTGGRRRGATEHFYRATRPEVFDNEIWASLPDSMKEVFSWRIFNEFESRLKDAMRARTFDARPERHFTVTPLLVDLQGWQSIVPKMDAFFEYLFEEQGHARVRLAESGEQPIPMTVGLAAFESPKDTTKAP